MVHTRLRRMGTTFMLSGSASLIEERRENFADAPQSSHKRNCFSQQRVWLIYLHNGGHAVWRPNSTETQANGNIFL
jgi:hypothetical protein